MRARRLLSSLPVTRFRWNWWRCGMPLPLTVSRAPSISLKALKELGVSMYTSTMVKRVEGTAVVLERDGREMRVEGIDQIILAVGMRPSQGLKEALAGTGLEVRSIGDAASVKNGVSNVQEAFAAAWDI
mgnify:CR=1 FL=1